MENSEELYMGLKDIIEEKDIKEICDFLYLLFKAGEKNNKHEGDIEEIQEDEDYESEFEEIQDDKNYNYNVNDVAKYLEFVEGCFNNKEFWDTAKENNRLDNPYKILLPCLLSLIDNQDSYDLFAEKVKDINNLNYSNDEKIEIINALLSFSEFGNGGPVDNLDIISKIDFKNELEVEDFDDSQDFQEFEEINTNLKNELYSIIKDLSVNDFLQLDYINLDSFYNEIINEQIKKMDEVQLYKYLLETGSRNSVLINRLKELNSFTLYNLYANINDCNYNEKYNKIEYLCELRNNARYEFEDNKDFKLYLNKLKQLNKNEFILYLIKNYYFINENNTKEEMQIIEDRIKQLADIDIETAYSIIQSYYEGFYLFDEEIKKRNLLTEKIYKINGKEYKDKELRDNDIVSKREKIYSGITDFNYSEILPTLPNYKSEKVEKAIRFCDTKLIKTICDLDKYSNLQLIEFIMKLNETEKYNEYEEAFFDLIKDSFDSSVEMKDEEKIEKYIKMCKYQVITYLNKRLLSMPEGYKAIIENNKNENGIFAEAIEMAYEDIKTYLIDKSETKIDEETK